MLHLELGVVADQFLEEGGEQAVPVGQGQRGGGGQPEQHRDELAGQRPHHLALELAQVDLGELVDVVVDLLGEPLLVVLEQVDEQGRAAGQVQLAVEVVGRALVHLAHQVEQQLDYAALQHLLVRLRVHCALLDVVAQHRHAPLHHLRVLRRPDARHDMLVLFGHVELLQVGPHGLGNAHHVVHHHLVKKPDVSADLGHLEQEGVQQHQRVFDEVDAFLREHEFHYRHHVWLYPRHCLLLDGGLDDASDSFEATCGCELGLAIVVVLVRLLCVFVEQLEKEFGEVLDEVDGEGPDFVGEVLDDALEGVDYILQIVVFQQLEIDGEYVLEEGPHEILGGLMLENAVEGDGSLDAHQRRLVLGQAQVDALHRLAHHCHLQLHRPVLAEDVHRPRPQKHYLVAELGNYVLRYQLRQYLLYLLALCYRRTQLADQVHRQLLLDWLL